MNKGSAYSELYLCRKPAVSYDESPNTATFLILILYWPGLIHPKYPWIYALVDDSRPSENDLQQPECKVFQDHRHGILKGKQL